ncbi:MAG: hypothetical protein J2O44_08190 [Porphyrobacter sp.]|nr:hypothetical protein [Porphyrobacter sp.]
MKIEIIDDARAIYKRWSVRFLLIAGPLLSAAAADRNDVVAALNSLPAPLQPFVPLLTLLFSLGVPLLLLLIKQPNLSGQEKSGG